MKENILNQCILLESTDALCLEKLFKKNCYIIVNANSFMF